MFGNDKRQKRQHSHERKKAESEFLKRKIEETYFSFSKWNTFFSSIYVSQIAYVKGEMGESDALELLKGDYEKGLHEKIEMLVHLYFPDLIEEYNLTRNERGKVIKFFSSNTKKVGDLPGFYSAQTSYEKSAENFKEKLKSLSDTLTY